MVCRSPATSTDCTRCSQSGAADGGRSRSVCDGSNGRCRPMPPRALVGVFRGPVMLPRPASLALHFSYPLDRPLDAGSPRNGVRVIGASGAARSVTAADILDIVARTAPAVMRVTTITPSPQAVALLFTSSGSVADTRSARLLPIGLEKRCSCVSALEERHKPPASR